MNGFAYKVLNDNRAAFHGGTGTWPAPNGKPGRWVTVKGELVACRNGLHLCRRDDLIHWLGPTIWIAEYVGEPVVDTNKIVVGKARLVDRLETWNERTARLFAADCADRALRKLARSTGRRSDPRSRAAVRAARDFADGKIGAAELAAAQDAARAAAWAAAWAAARAAAWAAARDAAWAAAWAAARDAAWDAEIRWQTKRLWEILDGKRYATDSYPGSKPKDTTG